METKNRFPKNIITKRPEGMNYIIYRQQLKSQKLHIKSNLLPGRSLEFGIAAMMYSPSKKMEIRRNEVINAKRAKPTNFTSKKPNRK